jgi:hypothetical protein
MRLPQILISVCALSLILVVFTGIVAKKRYTTTLVFTAYLAVVFVTDVLMLGWPGTFYTTGFYALKEDVINGLRFAVALEMAYRIFHAFPSARQTARRVLRVLLAATLVAVLLATADATDAPALLDRVQPRVVNASVWLFTVLAGLILWYRLPVDAFHKAILVGWVPYLLVFSAALTYVGSHGSQLEIAANRTIVNRIIEVTNYIHTVAYLGLLTYWAKAAWAPVGVRVSAAAKPAVALQSSPG